MPAKNKGFDNNDLTDAFAEDTLLGGDQSKPPGDPFAEDNLMQGDEGGNMPNDDEDIEFVEEDDDDEDDAKWLEKATAGPQKNKSQVARQNSQASKQSAKRESGWAGNGLGSGQL